MILTRSPLIVVGQVFLNTGANEYAVITSNNRGHISFAGIGFKGQCDDVTFIERFPPVDPQDLDEYEVEELLSFVPTGTVLSTGFIVDTGDDDGEVIEIEDEPLVLETVGETEPVPKHFEDELGSLLPLVPFLKELELEEA